MEHLLFAGYLILFAWLVTKIKFFTKSGLTNPQLVILFLLKVMAGIFYGWIGVYYGEMAQMIDTWAYHVESLQEYQLLRTHPGQFFTNIFSTTYDEGFANFLTTKNSWWNDIKANFLIKILAVFNLLSLGHYYVNVIFYSFLTLFGPIALYRVMKDFFASHKWIILIAAFLIPSFLYWTSGLHKEGLIALGLSLILYHFYFGFRQNRFPPLRIATILVGFILVLILRNFLVLILLPPLFAWIVAEKTRLRPAWAFSIVTVLSLVVFFTGKHIHPKMDFVQATVIKQQEFMKLSGGSSINVDSIQPSVKSFILNAPQAVSISAIRPYPSDVRHLLSLAAALEVNFLLLFFIVFLIWRKKGPGSSSLLLFCLVFSFSLLMMVGYTVNNLGAVVRYRSIILPFLVVPMAATIDWRRIYQLITGDITKNNNVI